MRVTLCKKEFSAVVIAGSYTTSSFMPRASYHIILLAPSVAGKSLHECIRITCHNLLFNVLAVEEVRKCKHFPCHNELL